MVTCFPPLQPAQWQRSGSAVEAQWKRSGSAAAGGVKTTLLAGWSEERVPPPKKSPLFQVPGGGDYNK